MNGVPLVVRRVFHAALVIVLSYTLVFFALFILPGNPIRQQIENPQNPLPKADAEILLHYYNLDKSAIEQFWISVHRLLHGDLGYSLTTGKPVALLIREAIPQTLSLATTASVFTLILAFAIALTAVFLPVRGVRGLARMLPGLFLSTPTFLTGFLLLEIFSFQLGWVSAIVDEGFKSVILPALALAVAVSAPIAQVLIQGLEKTYHESFVRVLRAKGLSEWRIILQHVLKNASIPALTLIGLTVGELLAGSIITEAVFSRTGLGFLTGQAVHDKDSPIILAVVVLVSIVFVLLVLATDLTYPLIDPRIASHRTGRSITGRTR
jgi:peptide/nickel transport system permease protein